MLQNIYYLELGSLQVQLIKIIYPGVGRPYCIMILSLQENSHVKTDAQENLYGMKKTETGVIQLHDKELQRSLANSRSRKRQRPQS